MKLSQRVTVRITEGEHSDVGCGNLALPPTEFLEVTGNPPDCPKMWFTADAVLPEGQQATLPEYMAQPGAAAGPPQPSALEISLSLLCFLFPSI